jgi:hypothetical protein
MEVQLESMAVEMPRVEGHPNRCEFRGVLTVVDAPSERAPSGARGHRVVLTRKAAEAGLASLLGMALDYAPTMDRHDARRKIGVITAADFGERGRLEIEGYLYAKDFPEIVKEIGESGRARLGLSYEIADARVADVNASVWVVTQCTFTGAAVLLRDKAAYANTWIELQ